MDSSIFQEKYVPIIRVTITVVFLLTLTLINGQDREFPITDSTQVVDVLAKDLLHRKDLGSAWVLTAFINKTSSVTYRFEKHIRTPDSLIVLGTKAVSPRITQRLFQPLLTQPLTYGTDRVFREIKNSQPFLNQHTVLTYARLEETPLAVVDFQPVFASEISGIAGGQKTADKGWIITGEIQVHLENAWRSAGTIDFLWNRLDESSQKITISIDEPYPFGLPLGGGGSYSQEIRSGLFTQTREDVYLSGIGGLIGRWKAGSSLVRSQPTLDGKTAGLTALRERLIRLEINRNSLNDRWLPGTGSSWVTGVRFGSQTGGDLNQWLLKFQHDWEWYVSPVSWWVWKTRLVLDGILNETGEISEYQWIRSGGIQSIRGYPEQIFQVDRQALFTVEGQPVLNNQLRGVFFIDLAYIHPKLSPNPRGWGLGFIQNSKSVLIKFYYGIGRGDALTDGQIHFQVINKL